MEALRIRMIPVLTVDNGENYVPDYLDSTPLPQVRARLQALADATSLHRDEIELPMDVLQYLTDLQVLDLYSKRYSPGHLFEPFMESLDMATADAADRTKLFRIQVPAPTLTAHYEG